MNPIDIAQKWSSMTAASAWEAWVEYTLACQENRAKVQGSLIRLLHRTLYAAFTAWQDAAADRAHQRAKIATCVARISNRSLAEAFHGWQEALHHQRDLQDRLASCLQRWRLQGLATAFQAFQANAVKQRKAKAVQPYPGPSLASTKLTIVLQYLQQILKLDKCFPLH
ncbi:hypothetical protein ABBQ32_008952 [Trebouxia sp. C0010 RCD-2024]